MEQPEFFCFSSRNEKDIASLENVPGVSYKIVIILIMWLKNFTFRDLLKKMKMNVLVALCEDS